ncbi:MAG: UDP-glucose 4-epimerase GalE [Vicinamibacterales bacterium]|nr:UDP-glucose 4-epimerase GalE [Vicinamibacterales bacterium]
MRILVTGGAGYIGSVLTDTLIERGHTVTVFDNLSRGHRDAVSPAATFIEGDLADSAVIASALKAQKVEAVVHMAGDALVGESMQNPGRYYRTNVVAGLSLLEAMRDNDVRLLVFSSTCAVYGVPEHLPIVETTPARPVNPYGDSKLAFERALGWFHAAHGFRVAALRYFNAAGASARCGERHEPETHLIPQVLDVAAGKRPHVTLFGNDYPTRDGTCVRDYIHVLDLADAHILALDTLQRESPKMAIYNLGCGGEGYSNLDVIECARRVTGKEIRVVAGPRRPGDPPVLVASADKARRELGWIPRREQLETIVQSAWSWMTRA